MATAALMEVEAIRLPDLFEVIHGEIVEVHASYLAIEIANSLHHSVSGYLIERDIGRSRIEQMYHIPVPRDALRLRRPAVAFVSYKRLPKMRKIPRHAYAMDGVVPELAVEIVSPADPACDLQGKVMEYLNAGVKLVWVIYPEICQVHAYTSPTSIRICGATGDLDGGDVLPGFAARVAELFPKTDDDSAGD